MSGFRADLGGLMRNAGLKLPLYIEAGPGIAVREGLVGGTGLEPVTSAV